MSNFPTLVVVLNYRGAAVLLPCLQSLVAQMAPDDRMLVIDHGHELELMAMVRQSFPEVEIYVPSENGGFARGMNYGLREALRRGFSAAWLVNNDTVAAPQALSVLKAAALDYPGANLFSPLITTPQDTVWFAGGQVNFWRMRTEHVRVIPSTNTPFQTRFLTGCALFVPRITLEQVGFLDERYFLYYEDADYSVRTLAQGGTLWVIPQARVIHSEASEMNPEKIYWLVRSGTEFFWLHTRGQKRLWVRAFLGLRRLKNRLRRIFFPGPVAEKLERAYTDALKYLS